jgi:hypothetical protein
MPARRSHADKVRFFKLIGQGVTQMEACRQIGIHHNTGQAWLKDMRDNAGNTYRQNKELKKLADPIPYEKMSPDAQKAHDDFEYFRRVHFGRVSSPWQVDAGWKFQDRLWTPQKEYINLNCPPGGGKSTLLHDIECWLTVRRRSIRGMLGSATQRLATKYNKRLLRSFERARPPQIDPTELAAGRAVEPIASLAKFYGRFQPDMNDLWRAEEFIVAQIGDLAVGEKEATWQAYGLDTEYLGNRVDIAVWDDVVTKRTMRTIEAIENQRDVWDDQAETRIEPGGALFLVGQRLGALDLYAYNKAKAAGLSDDEAFEAGMGIDDFDDNDEPADDYFEIEPEGSQKPRMYTSIVYPAHDEAKCKGLHSSKDPKFWAPDNPDNCLLDPVRLPWRELHQKQQASNEKYRTVYQQEDVDPESVLVPRIWITGGEHNGEQFPGCYDKDRGYHEVPKNLNGNAYSIVTVDPSPTKFWSVQWWLYDEESELRFLMDNIRQKMGAEDFLSYNPDERLYTGVLEDLWQLSKTKGRPFNILIVERNGAQRFLLQLDYFKRWCALRGVSIYPHDTMANKSDPDFGVQTIATHYRHGRVRLPNKHTPGDMGFIITRLLVDEVTVWPDGATDDCVMAQWFLEWWLPRIAMPNVDDMPLKRMPSWEGGEGMYSRNRRVS